MKTALLLITERCDPSPLREMDSKEITSKMIFDLAQKGDAIALEAFDQTAKISGMKLADAVALTGPDAIFLSGGLSMAGDILLKPTQQYMEDFLFGAYKSSAKLILSGMAPGKSAILGAVALIWSELDL